MTKRNIVKTTTTRSKPKGSNVTTTVVSSRQGRRKRNRASPRTAMCSDGQKYLRCLLGEDTAKIPDGDSHHSVLLNYESVATVSPDTSGNLVVACLPGLPGSLRIVTGSGTFPDRAGLFQTFTDVYPSGLTIPFPDYARTPPGSNDLTANFAEVAAARVVSYEMEVMQVGPVLYQQGSAVTARVPYMPGDGWVPMATAPIAAAGAIWPGQTYASLTSHQPTKPLFSPGTIRFQTISTYPTSKMCNATVPCKLLGKGCGNWTPVWLPEVWQDQQNPMIGDTIVFTHGVTTQGSASGAWGGAFQPITNLRGYPCFPLVPASGDQGLVGDFWTDPECEALVWAGTNFTNTAMNPVTFQVRVKVCMELDVSYGNSIYRPLITPPVQEDRPALAAGAKLMKALPASVSNAEGAQGWMSSISQSVVGLTDIVGDLGIPFLSPAAKLGVRFAKALGLG